MLQKDLDLIVKAPDGTERHGNAGLSVDFDRLNNVEQVVWTNMPAGAAKITIPRFQDYPVSTVICICIAQGR
jgi:serine protease AprX